MEECINGYGLDQLEYEKLVDRFYGFEEYYYYKKSEYYNDYKFVISKIEDIRNDVPMNEQEKNAIIGYWISFKNLKRKLIQNDIGLNITNACQLKCKHCFRQDEPRTNTHMSYEEFLYALEFYDRFMKKFVHYNPRNHNKINIAFSGGETTLNPYLTQMMEYVYSNPKYDKVLIATNGLYIPDDILNLMVQYKHRTTIQVSIDGLKETHDYIRGKGTFDITSHTIEKLRNLGLNVIVAIEINSLNYKDSYVIQKEDTFKTSNYRERFYTPQQSLDIKPCSKEELQSINYIDTYQDPCPLGHIFMIEFNGDYKTCSRIPTSYCGNIFKDSMDDIFKNFKKEVIRSRSVPVYCFNCKYVNNYVGCNKCNINRTDNKFYYNIADIYCEQLERKNNTSFDLSRL